MPMSHPGFVLERLAGDDAGTMVLRFDRPDKLNPLSDETVAELHRTLDTLAHDAALRVLVLTGSGRAFCAGFDLSEAAAAPGEDTLGRAAAWTARQEAFAGLVSKLRGLRAPVIAAVNGTAAGAGVGLVAMSDLAVCGEGTRFSLAYTGVALTPDGSTSFFLPQILGNKRALELMLTNRPLGAVEALQWGLVNQVVADGEVLSAALALAERLASGPRAAQAAVKRLVALAGGALEAHLATEGETIARQSVTAEGQEGIRAFLEKRKPKWVGH